VRFGNVFDYEEKIEEKSKRFGYSNLEKQYEEHKKLIFNKTVFLQVSLSWKQLHHTTLEDIKLFGVKQIKINQDYK